MFLDPTPEADECNRIAVAGGAEEFPSGSDGYGYTAVTCLQLKQLVAAIEAVEGTITQASVIEALEAMAETPMSAGPPGSLSADKHDAGDAVFLSRYSAASEKFEATDNQTPIPID